MTNPLLVPFDRNIEPRLRRHQEIVAAILNSLIRKGYINQTDINEWNIDLGDVYAVNTAIGAMQSLTDGEDGRPGVPGQDGRSGKDGLPGIPGVDGEDGLIGIPGLSGVTGATGLGIMGPAGQDGDDGTMGPPGLQGTAGAAGATGATGSAGVDGAAGRQGTDGADGDDGIGIPGLPGLPGAAGLAVIVPGFDGDDGDMGPMGLTGATGATGATGSTGAAGATGPAGSGGLAVPGEDGDEGQPGIPGLAGVAGREGIAGRPGLDGDDGDPGIMGIQGVPGVNCTTNLLINGGARIWQRQGLSAATRADDAYAADRWYVLTQTASISAGQATSNTVGTFFHNVQQTQASAQRVGYASIIENRDCQWQIQTSLFKSMSFQGRVACSSANVKIAVLGWAGTADAVTSDVVNNWTSTTYTPNNFFINTVTVLGIATLTTPDASQEFMLNVTTGTSVNNLIVFVWTESTLAQNVSLSLSELRLLPNVNTYQPWVDRPYAQELAMCQRYYEKNCAVDTPVADGAAAISVVGNAYSAADTQAIFPFKVPKRTTPTVTPFRSSLGATAGVYIYVGPGPAIVDFTSTSLAASEWGVISTSSKAASFAFGDAITIQGVWAADAEL